MNKLEIIRNVSFFSNFQDCVLSKIALNFNQVELGKNDILFREGEIGDSFYIITSGEIEIIKELQKDYHIETDLKILKPYSYFGEMALVDDCPRSATAKAKTDTELLSIDKDRFISICTEYPEIIFALIKTISERLRVTNERFIETWDSLLKKNKLAAIGTAVSKIVHDIKTPITVTVLTAQLIGKLYPDVVKYSEKIIKQINLLDDMVKEILEFAKGEQVTLNKQKVKVDEFLQELVDNIVELADAHFVKINLVNNYNGEAIFDKQKIYRTVTNIIKNAFEAIKKKGKIDIFSVKKEGSLHITIQDNGPGIPVDIIDKLFEPFVTKGKSGGTGLGLAISKKVIEDHQGKLIVANRNEGGARFDIYLPF